MAEVQLYIDQNNLPPANVQYWICTLYAFVFGVFPQTSCFFLQMEKLRKDREELLVKIEKQAGDSRSPLDHI